MNFQAKQFRNKICQTCIQKNIKKYGEFNCKCDGITVEDDVKFAMKQGYSEDDARWAFDPVYFFGEVYGQPARAYQKPQLLCTSRRIVGRQCRQSGKSLAYIYKVLHFLLTNENKTVLVIAPFEKLLKKLWDEYVLRDCLLKHPKTKATIVSKAMSPSYNILFDNGSRLIMMIAGEGARGQCMPAGTLVTMADGSQLPIENIDVDYIVQTFNDKTNKLEPQFVSAIHKNGIQDIYEIVTESNRKVRATGNHPFYINSNWTDADKIKPNDLIAIPRKVGFGSQIIDENLIKYLAYMIGDGACSSVQSTPFKFTVNNNVIMNEFTDICESLNIKYSISSDNRRENLFNIVMPARKTETCFSILNEFSLYGKKCDTKSVPKQIEHLSQEQLALFINRLYSTDGWISHIDAPRNAIQTEIGYCTTSEKLAMQLQYLLQKFDIKSRIQIRSKSLNGTDCKRQYIVKIRDKKEIFKFINSIGLIFGKEDKSKEVFDIVNHEKFIKRIDKSEICDIYFEKVKSCTFVGREETYNLTINNTHTFIANGIITHNTADWIYIDEAAIIPPDTLNSIVFTIASRGDDAAMLLTSTPKGRGNMFYKACKEDSVFNEYHVSIYDIPEMANSIEEFRKVSGEAGFEQECVAEFPDTAGGPFNYRGIDLAKTNYLYENCKKESNFIYFGGVDWNGPGVGTYFYIIGFDPNNNFVKVVDKACVASNTWNSSVAKSEFIRLNRKWEPKHWMCDAGYGHSIIEDLRLYSIQIRANQTSDAMIKHTLEPVSFGEWIILNDPFTKEEIKKTTKSFIVSQVARLFEPRQDQTGVNIAYSSDDNELTESLEMYKLLNTTAKGVEQYGFDKKDGIEDHAIDALMLACYGIVKYYGELFKRIIYQSVGFNARDILTPPIANEQQKTLVGSIILLTSTEDKPIWLDENSIHDPYEQKEIIVSRGFDRNNGRRSGTLSGIMSRRGTIVRRNFD